MRTLSLGIFLAFYGVTHAGDAPLILSNPAVSEAKRCRFRLCRRPMWWSIAAAARLEGSRSGLWLETNPVISLDGTQVAFAGEYDGNLDVYVVSIGGGEPETG